MTDVWNIGINEWGDTGDLLGCCRDCTSCFLFGPTSLLCCCLPTCFGLRRIGEMIGTPDATDATSYHTQLKSWSGCLFCGIGFFLCPEAWMYNPMTRALIHAQRRLGYINYPPPLGLDRHGPGTQMMYPGLNHLTLCLIYRKLQEAASTLPPLSHTESPPVLASYEWADTYGCCDDCKSCCMGTCSPCTCGISHCCLVREIGLMIGTPEALEATDHCQQCRNCCTYGGGVFQCIPVVGTLLNGCVTCCCIFGCPRQFRTNHDALIWHLAQEHLGYRTFPSPLAVAGAPGEQTDCCCTSSCTWCLLYRELKAKQEHDRVLPAVPVLKLGHGDLLPMKPHPVLEMQQ